MNSTARALYQQATAYYRQGRPLLAIASYRRLLSIAPGFADGWYDLGYLLKQQGQHQLALEAYQQALNHGVRDPQEVHLNRAVIYADHLRQDDQAEGELRAALQLRPDYRPAQLNLGNLHEERGDRDAAVASYRSMLGTSSGSSDLDELQLEALARLSQLQAPNSAEDADLQRLRHVAESATPSDPQIHANLWFALARGYDRLTLYDDAFAAYARANSLAARVGAAYSAAGTTASIQSIMDQYGAAASAATAASDGLQPLFICGMFRSGSTLIEQVLGGHKQTAAGGELDHFPRLAKRLEAAGGQVNDAQLESWSTEYLQHLRRVAGTDRPLRYVSDKRPDNFLLLGLIKRIFPAAKIIHTVRNPLDNGFALYMQHLDQRVAPHSSDLAAIGHFYGQYRRLMRHWEGCFGEDIHRFDYDQFVRDPQPALESLYAFLQLSPDPDALDFHQRQSTVKTASYWQVRQPLYTQASGRWRRYERHLAPLRDALLEAGVDDLEG